MSYVNLGMEIVKRNMFDDSGKLDDNGGTWKLLL